MAGIVALASTRGDASITVATAVSASALIGLVADEVIRTGPESARTLKKISKSVQTDLLKDIKLNRAAPADLEAADEALTALIGGCMLQKADLAACAMHSDGLPEHAASIIVERLAATDPRFAESASSQMPNSTFRQFAFKVVELALRSAFENRDYFARFQPYILSAISQGIGEVSQAVTQANLKLDEQGPKIDAIYTHILKIVAAPRVTDIDPSMTLAEVVECLVQFNPNFISVRHELNALILNVAVQADQAAFSETVPDFATSLRLTIEATEKALSRSGIYGVTTGLSDFDALLGGLQPSDLVILAGRPGMGKTALGTNIAFHAAKTWMQDLEAGAQTPRGAPVLLFSLEMPAQQVSARILAEQTEIELWKIRSGKFTDSEWEKFVLTMHDLSSLPLYIDDSSDISVAQIAERARRLKAEKQIGLIIIDYLQLLGLSGAPKEETVEFATVTRGLKALAKELNVPILALSQVSRAAYAEDSRRPSLSDLHEFSSIEEDADVVMFVFREEHYLKSREPEPGSPGHARWLEKMERLHRRAELLVEKNRHGATGTIALYFDERFNRFMNLGDPWPSTTL